MDVQSNNVVSVENRPYNQKGRFGFLKGNPGRKPGAKNRATVVRELLIASANRDTARIFKQHLRRPASKGEFTKAMDQLIALLGPSKPLSVVDQSTHTHFTVVVDGSSQQPAA